MSMPTTCFRRGAKAEPMQVLKDEHRVIEKVLDAAERRLRSAEVDRDFFLQALDFFQNFADGCHHAKEEDELFPVLEGAGIPQDGGPIEGLLRERQQGRYLLGLVRDNLDAASTGNKVAEMNLKLAATQYIAMLRQHIIKEDDVLFVMADHVLGPEEQKLMLDAFERAERKNGKAEKHERYLALAEELAQRSVHVA